MKISILLIVFFTISCAHSEKNRSVASAPPIKKVFENCAGYELVVEKSISRPPFDDMITHRIFSLLDSDGKKSEILTTFQESSDEDAFNKELRHIAIFETQGISVTYKEDAGESTADCIKK